MSQTSFKNYIHS